MKTPIYLIEKAAYGYDYQGQEFEEHEIISAYRSKEEATKELYRLRYIAVAGCRSRDTLQKSYTILNLELEEGE